ncbi:MAG: D-alanyl-D-alanine carboxypeptidase [Clostridia bacterium]|nr:D-alanyl-D-alanine carboxypeptidase [Clostridia bacterium]
MKRKCRFFFAVLLILCLVTGSVATGEQAATNKTTQTPSAKPSPSATPAPQKTEKAAPAPQFQVDAKAAVLIEASTGRVLYAFNENQPLPIASITKVMTMLLVMEAIDSGKIKPTDTVTISAYATKMGGSQVYLKEGEMFTVEELLKAVAVHSANDAAVALGEKVAGTEEAFVAMMNQRAEELKMKNTKFLDCTGLTDEGHFSSALDIAIMSRELLVNHPKITYYTTIWHDTFRDGKFDLDNTNKLVKRYRGATGLKTGFTNKAGFCLSASAEREGTKFISVILGSKSNDARFSESARLLDFAFSNWESAAIEKMGLQAGIVKVKKGVATEIPVTFSENATVVVKKGSKGKITETVEVPELVNAPVKAGQPIGVLNIDLEGERLASIPIVAAKDSEKCSFGLVAGMVADRWAKLFVK